MSSWLWTQILNLYHRKPPRLKGVFITAAIPFPSHSLNSSRFSHLSREAVDIISSKYSQCLHCSRACAPLQNSVHLHLISRKTMTCPVEGEKNKPLPTPTPPLKSLDLGKVRQAGDRRMGMYLSVTQTIVLCECLIKKTQWLHNGG